MYTLGHLSQLGFIIIAELSKTKVKSEYGAKKFKLKEMNIEWYTISAFFLIIWSWPYKKPC